MWLDHLLTMMPTLEQINRLNRFLVDLYFMELPPDIIKFSHREGKPFIMIAIEPMHDIKIARWITIDWEGDLGERDEK